MKKNKTEKNIAYILLQLLIIPGVIHVQRVSCTGWNRTEKQINPPIHNRNTFNFLVKLKTENSYLTRFSLRNSSNH